MLTDDSCGGKVFELACMNPVEILVKIVLLFLNLKSPFCRYRPGQALSIFHTEISILTLHHFIRLESGRCTVHICALGWV